MDLAAAIASATASAPSQQLVHTPSILSPPSSIQPIQPLAIDSSLLTANYAQASYSPQEVVDCICGVKADDGKEMVSCDSCRVWQHIACVHFYDPNPNAKYLCPKCKESINYSLFIFIYYI